MSSKILISGTGRCGTTFLIKLFTFLGMDTGYTTENYEQYIHTECNSGMERWIDSKYSVLKSPNFLAEIHRVVQSVRIRAMIIPIRNFTDSAVSRTHFGNGAGGLWNAHDTPSQIAFYKAIMANYLYYMVRYDIPTIFLDFTRMVTDAHYLFTKLRELLEVSELQFMEAYRLAESTSKPSGP